MSATLLLIVLISVGAIAFFVRFLIALCKEGRGGHVCKVLRIGPELYELQSRTAFMHTIRLEGAKGRNGRRVSPINVHSNGGIAPPAYKALRRIIQ